MKSIRSETVIDPIQNQLNQKFFNGMKLRRRIRKAMLDLFNHFTEQFTLTKVDQFILEKNFVGSMTSFQWSEDSDIDLHLIIDDEAMANEYNATSLEILESLRQVSKQLNGKLYLLGYPIEFYVQAKDEPFYSDGVYDVEYDTWSKVPEIKEFDKDKVKKAKQLAKDYKKYISTKLKEMHKRYVRYEKDSSDIENIKKLKNDYIFINDEIDNIKDKRNKSIRAEGNDSIMNMKFKFLHRLEVLEIMTDARKILKSIYFEPTTNDSDNR